MQIGDLDNICPVASDLPVDRAGSLLWRAPELFHAVDAPPGAPSAAPTKESDVFSMGVTIWEVLSQVSR